MDRAIAAALLLVTAPVLIGIALAIKIDSRGPVFSRSTRIGHDDKVFRVWRFRSTAAVTVHVMECVGCRSDIHAAGHPASPQLTRVGRVIHETGLEGLPQLFNVLTGTMTLVGPRPHDGADAGTQTSPTRPGMIVVTRGDDSAADDDWSVKRDATIMWRTFRAAVAEDKAA